MADFSSPAPTAGSVQENIFPVKPAIAVVLAALADWLFYDQQIGISAVVFTLALICGSVLVNLATLEKTQALLAGLVVLLGLLPAVEEFNTASLIFIASVARRWPTTGGKSKIRKDWTTRIRPSRPVPVRSIQVLPGRPWHVQFAEHVGGPCRVVCSGGPWRCLRISVRVGQSTDREMGQPHQPWQRRLLYRRRTDVVLDRGIVRGLALHPCPVAQQAQGDEPFGRGGCSRTRTATSRHRLLRCCNDPAFADSLQPAVCGSDHPRHGLSLGQRDAACRHQLCVLCASRRLSPHCHGVTGGGIRSRSNEARRPGRTIKGDPAAGLSLGRAERPAGRVIDPAPRPLCADLLCSPVGASRPLSGWALSPSGFCSSSPASC